jgi:acyl-CoA synthetase (NDP forming)
MNTTQSPEKSRVNLDEVAAKALLHANGVPVTETVLATTVDEAVATAERLGYPVVLKIVSPDVIHKSDVGGVKLRLKDAAAVAEAYDEIISSVTKALPGARICGVSVQQMAPAGGVEVIIGVNRDPQFGPVLMFGLGGVFVEVMKDVVFRVAPLEPLDAQTAIREIKSFPLLNGFRGAASVDLAALEQLLLQVSRFAESHPEILELDLNPVLAYADRVVAVDARITRTV